MVSFPLRPRTWLWLTLLSTWLSGSAWCWSADPQQQNQAAKPATAAAAIDFNRQIRPILAETCFTCHGPDKNQRQAELRLDLAEEATRDLGGRRAIVPGKPDQSQLWQRITATDRDERMPPADAARQLTAPQIELLRQWIASGARYDAHWSFRPLVRRELPPVAQSNWPRQPLDRWVLAELERQGLQPAPEAPPEVLIRRLFLDLVGLPPTPAEAAEFVAEYATDATPTSAATAEQRQHRQDQVWQRWVERLLESPRYGERMASWWLDCARYADTNGYQSDGPRFMWRWRDWVIDSFNRHQPFDQFTLEQLAGDLLPDATMEQRIATGFNRNHRGNSEGGIIPAEYQVEYVVDRVDTTATVWLGLTAGCARCHDHKYDPLSQREYYQLFAYFNNVPELGKVIRDNNSPPVLKSPTPAMQKTWQQLEAAVTAAQESWEKLQPERRRQQAAWQQELAGKQPADWTIDDQLTFHVSWDAPAAKEQAAPASKEQSIPAAALQFEPAPELHDGALGQAAGFNGRQAVVVSPAPELDKSDRFTIACWVHADQQPDGVVLSRVDEPLNEIGYELKLAAGKLQLHLVNRTLDDCLRVETQEPLVSAGRWHHLAATYDGSVAAAGAKLYVDGQPAQTVTLVDLLSNAFKTTAPFRVGGRESGGGLIGRIDEVRIHARDLEPAEIAILATRSTIAELAALPAEKLTPVQALKLSEYFVRHHGSPELKQAHDLVRQSQRKLREFIETVPTTMVMQELPQPRITHLLIRGEYDKPGDVVQPGVPGFLQGPPRPEQTDRLGLARWLVDRRHPLTARVAANRIWQLLFGVGLVKTAEDFGSQGEPPVHPDLLDHLAWELMDRGWSLQALQRTIVCSATYRQNSVASASLLKRDPENRLLARGPRFRLSAEMIRDQALYAGGLLVERVGGPSVKPYQPAGLWEEVASSGADYVQDHGLDLYRRSLYTYWKRTVAPPGMMTFDASARETCLVRPSRTNTPLQALTLLNDVTYVEAARALAQRAALEAGPLPADRLTRLFRLVAVRAPTPDELVILEQGYQRHLARYRADRPAAEQLLKFGESARNSRVDLVEHAALTAVASVVLNLDEVLTKE